MNRVFALIILLFILPIFICLSIAVAISDGFPIIFKQKRIGHDGKNFRFYKFRTMIKNAAREKIKWQRDNPELWKEYEDNNFKLKNDKRVTKLGNFLRKTSLDELPQLFNIIKGEMVFVGPRPLLLREKRYYGKNFRYYKKVKPGVTGLWQVMGRSDTTFVERIKFDRYYTTHKSFKLDLFILLKTIQVTLFKKGSY